MNLEITTKSHIFSEIPTLEVVAQKNENQKNLPTIIFYHGWMSQKESQLGEAYFYAKNGFRVFLPDAKWHGERRPKNLDYNIFKHLPEAIMANYREFPKLLKAIKKAGFSFSKPFIQGMSMGGITVSFIAAGYTKEIKGVAQMIGTPNMLKMTADTIQSKGEKLRKLPGGKKTYKITDFSLNVIFRFGKLLLTSNLASRPQKIAKLPYFIYHGANDDLVPVDYDRNFAKIMKEKYPNAPFKYIEFEKQPHWVPFRATKEAIKFLGKYK